MKCYLGLLAGQHEDDIGTVPSLSSRSVRNERAPGRQGGAYFVKADACSLSISVERDTLRTQSSLRIFIGFSSTLHSLTIGTGCHIPWTSHDQVRKPATRCIQVFDKTFRTWIVLLTPPAFALSFHRGPAFWIALGNPTLGRGSPSPGAVPS